MLTVCMETMELRRRECRRGDARVISTEGARSCMSTGGGGGSGKYSDRVKRLRRSLGRFGRS